MFCRKVWRTEDKRPSISSEESLSDYEEAGGTLPGTGGLQGRSRGGGDGRSQIWENREIQASLRYRTGDTDLSQV